jgi:nucleotide-binding universal stress UspA family protein
MIVVGVDGSGSSGDAIRWAVNEARLRKTDVVALYVWQSPIGNGHHHIPPDLLDPAVLEGHARQIVEAAVTESSGPRTDVGIESRTVQGSPAAALIDASRGADLLVLGSRGHGGFSGLLLGSVGHQCVQHAVCPVVIVRPSGDGKSERSMS